MNHQLRDHEIGEGQASSGRAAERKPALQPVHRPVLQGHVFPRHLPGGGLAASRAAASPAPLME